jgi:(p)ppGpp synthase/HD superfamily hydrolase
MEFTEKYQKLPEALAWAFELHLGDFRDGSHALPYISHPVDVLNLLRYVGKVTDEDLLIAAILHDVVEETAVDPRMIQTRFGVKVASLVAELTRAEPAIDTQIETSKELIWNIRSETLLQEISVMSAAAQTIKLADRLSNYRQAKATRKPEKLKRYRKQTKKILEIIPKTVNRDLWNAIRDEL